MSSGSRPRRSCGPRSRGSAARWAAASRRSCTEDGWLLIYHAVETFPDQPFIYRAGAALLDAANPSQVIARLPYPILEPETDYELYGDVGNVVFPVGGYVYDGDLYISYGAADRCVALATTPLESSWQNSRSILCT